MLLKLYLITTTRKVMNLHVKSLLKALDRYQWDMLKYHRNMNRRRNLSIIRNITYKLKVNE